jgi:hypothetical protein
MVLSYHNIFQEDGNRMRIKAEITTDHPASSYGKPVIVFNDGGVLDLMSWETLGYRVEKATEKERSELQKMGLL